MHYVQVPEAIQLKTPASQGGNAIGEPKKFLDWMLEVVLNDPRGVEGGPVKMRHWQKIIDKFEKYCNPGDVVVLEDEEFRKLKEIASAPQARHQGLVAVQLIPFFEAVTEAGEKDPRPPAATAGMLVSGTAES